VQGFQAKCMPTKIKAFRISFRWRSAFQPRLHKSATDTSVIALVTSGAEHSFWLRFYRRPICE
jgi:hypothetical protein